MNSDKKIQKLATLLSEYSDSTLLLSILEQLLTVAELDDIATRLEILERLYRGESQRKIVKDLGVGIATVTRGSRVLQEKPGLCELLFEK